MNNLEMFFEVYQNLQWVFSLGYVTILSIVATIYLVKLERVTILKKMLSGATAMQKDSILGLAGTITSLVVFTLVHFANEMIIQGKFLIDFNKVTQAISIPSGAAIVWSGSKGVYTVVHKWWQRVKAGEKIDLTKASKELSDEMKKPTLSISEALAGGNKMKNKVDTAKVDKKAIKEKQKAEKAKAKAKKKRTKEKAKALKKGLVSEKKVINRRTKDNGEV